MMVAETHKYVSFDAYIDLEHTTSVRHEYYRGAVYAMTGASPRHNLIVANVIGVLHAQLRGKQCTVYPSDLRMKVEQTGLYTYPDVSVICGDLQLISNRSDTVTNPTVIIEVLSPSTKDYDRGTKFQHYRTIATLQEYIVIDQATVHIEHYIAQESGHWLLIEYVQKEQRIPIDSIDCELELAVVYEKVTFSTDDERDQADTDLH